MTYQERLTAAHEGQEYDLASLWAHQYIAECQTAPGIAEDIDRIGETQLAALLIAAILLRDTGADTAAKLRHLYTHGDLPEAD